MTEIKLVQTADIQVKNRNKNLFLSANKNLRDIEFYLIQTKAEIYVISGDLQEYDIPNDSERKLINNHLSRVLNIPTIKEVVIMAGNHDLIKDKKLDESTTGYNPINIFADMVSNLDKDKFKKLLYVSESKVYQSRVDENIQYLVYSLEDKMQIDFHDADPNKLKFVLFHDMLKEYVDSVKLPLRKDVYNELHSVDSFPPDTIILAGDIHKRLKFVGLDNQVFYYPGSTRQLTHAEGSYLTIGDKIEIKPAEEKALKMFSFDTDQCGKTLSKIVEVEDIPLTNYVSYVTINLEHKIPFEALKQNLMSDDLKIEFGEEQTFIKVKSSNLFIGHEGEIRNILNKISEDKKRVNIEFEYEKFIDKNNTSNNKIIQEIINEKSQELKSEDSEKNNDVLMMNADNIDDLILSNIQIEKIFDSIIDKQLSKNKIDEVSEDDLRSDILNLFKGELSKYIAETKRFKINFESVETDGFMALKANRIELAIPGITRILGTNGIGKTTLYNIIRWVIKGEVFDNMSKKTVNKNNLLVFNKKDINKDNVICKLKMNINDSVVIATRWIERKWKNNTTDEQKKLKNWTDFVAKVDRGFKLEIVQEDGEIKTVEGETAEKAILLWFGNTIDWILFMNQAKIDNLLNTSSSELNQLVLNFIGVEYLKKLELGLDDVKSELMTVAKPKLKKDDILLKITDNKIYIKKYNKELEQLNDDKESEGHLRDIATKLLKELNTTLVEIGDIPNIIVEKQSVETELNNFIDNFEEKKKQDKIPFNTKEPVLDQTKINEITLKIKTNNELSDTKQKDIDDNNQSILNREKLVLEMIPEVIEVLESQEAQENKEENILTTKRIEEFKNITKHIDNIISQLIVKQEEKQKIVNQLENDIEIKKQKIQTNLTTIESGVCSECLRPFEDNHEAHKEKLTKENEELQKEIDLIDVTKDTELIEKIKTLIKTYNEYRDKSVSCNNEICDINELKKDCGTYFENIKGFEKDIEKIIETKTQIGNEGNIWESMKNISSKVYNIDEINKLSESDNKTKLITLVKEHKKFHDLNTILEGDIDGLAKDNKILDDSIKTINTTYTSDLETYQKNLTENVRLNNEVDIHNNTVEEHNKSLTTKQTELTIVQAELIVLRETKLPKYEKQKEKVDDVEKQIETHNTEIETYNKSIESKKLIILSQEKDMENNQKDYDDFILYEKNNVIWKVYSTLIKTHFKEAIFEYYRIFLNNTLNELLSDVDFQLYWDDNSELYMVDYKNGQCSYQPVQSSSGMETCFLGLSLVYTIHLLNVKNNISHIFIDEISGTLSSGKNLSYDSKDYQEILVLILNKFKDKSIFIIDHHITNLFETSTYEVNPTELGSEYKLN